MYTVKNDFIVNDKNSYETVMPKLMTKARKLENSVEDIEVRSMKDNNFRLIDDTLHFRHGSSERSFSMTEVAMYQLCKKIGLPVNYYHNLAKSRNATLNDLAQRSINTLMGNCSDAVLLRTCGGYNRAVLSTRYTAFDALDVLEVFDDVVQKGTYLDKKDIAIRGYVNSMEYFHLRFTGHTPMKGLRDKDLYYGLQITSSDVGLKTLRVRFWIYKQICTNGMMMSIFDRELYGQRHIGVTRDDFRAGLSNAFMVYPTLIDRAASFIRGAEGMSLVGNSLLKVLQPNDDLDKYPIRCYYKKYLGLSDEAMNMIAYIAVTKYDETLWGYCNAITEYAQRLHIAERLDLERKAFVLMNNVIKNGANVPSLS